MNAYLIMAGQGGIALGSILLATGASHVGLRLTLGAAAALALVGLGLGYRFSINFPRKDGPDAPQASADTLPASEEQNEEPSATSSMRFAGSRDTISAQRSLMNPSHDRR